MKNFHFAYFIESETKPPKLSGITIEAVNINFAITKFLVEDRAPIEKIKYIIEL